MTLLKTYFGIFVVLILSFWAIKPLLIPGFFPMHDDTQVARVFEMGKALKDGMFPVRWVPDLGYGYGYPIFNFYAPLAYYVGGLFTLIGFDALVATKIMMVLGILLSGVFMYFLAKEFWGRVGGMVSALFYVYAPYHAVDIYVRGDVAEFWAYAFIPLLALGVYKKNILLGAIGYAGIILSHNLTVMMITPFLFIAILLNCYIVQKGRKLLILYHSSLILFLGLTISAFYWLPALLELKNTNVLSQVGGGADFRDHFVCLGQLWSSPWGFGGSTKGCIDGLSFMIGKIHIIGSVTAIALAFFAMRNKNYNSYKDYILLAFAGFILSSFLTLGISKPIWQAIPLMAFFQYPWRFLIMTSFFSSFLLGFVVWFFQFSKPGLSIHFKPGLYIFISGVLIFFLLFFNLKFFVPQTIFPVNSSDFTNEKALKWVASKTSDEFLPPNFKKPKNEKEIIKEPIIFQETPIEKTSNLISWVTLIIVGIILFKAQSKQRHE